MRWPVRFTVLVGLCVAAMIAYVLRQSLAVAESTIRTDLDLSKEQMSLVMSTFFWVYALGQIPSGAVAQRLGSRRTLPVFALLWSAANALFALAVSLPTLIVTKAMDGLAQAGLFPGAVNVVSRWFPRNERATANGLLAASMGAGAAVGALLTGELLRQFEWQDILLGYAAAGALWAMLFYGWFRERPEEHPQMTERELDLIHAGAPRADASRATEGYEPTPWLALVASPALWWICLQQFCRAAGEIFFATWFATYLQEAKGMSIAQSGMLTALPIVARVAGSLTGGTVSDIVLTRTGSLGLARKGVSVASLAMCATLVISAIFVDHAWLAVTMISLGMFCGSLAGPCAYTITIDMGGRHVPAVFATMNMIGNLGAAAFPPVAAVLRVQTGSWFAVLVLFAGLYLAAAGCWLMVNTRGTILEQSLAHRGNAQ